MSLLDTAKSVTPALHASRSRIGDEEVELALAWVHDEITMREAAEAWRLEKGLSNGWGVRFAIMNALKKYIKENNI